MRTPYELGRIGKDPESQKKRGWTLWVNGEEITEPIEEVELNHDRMGLKLRYGKHPGGYDVWKFHEPGGGGSVTMPWAVIDGRLLIGVVTQNRPAAGGVIDEAPRGFLNPNGETHPEAAARETREETGLDAIRERFVLLGDSKNPNTAFFDTSAEGEGISFYGLQVMPDELTLVESEDGGPSYYAFSQSIRAQAQSEGDGVAERILGSRFISPHEAQLSDDLMTAAGMGLLMTHMLGSNTLQLAGVERG